LIARNAADLFNNCRQAEACLMLLVRTVKVNALAQ